MNSHTTDEKIPDNAKRLLHKLYSEYSIETTPRLDKKIDSYQAILPKNTSVMIASPNATTFNQIIRSAKRLRNEGMEPVPHIIARRIPDLALLKTLLDQLQTEAEVDHILVIAGDIPSPVGPYHSSMELLNTGVFEKRGIKKIGVSGHPEGSPHVSDKELLNAILWKNEYASQSGNEVYLCTQLVFEALPVISWEQKIRNEGNQLPVKVGVPGIATLQTLLHQATTIGIGQSVRYLTRQAPYLKKLMTHTTPQQLIKDVAIHCAQDSSTLIEGIHFFPFGGMEKTSHWVTTQLSSQHNM